MPELPEVETVVRQLAPQISGQKLKRLRVLDKKLIKLQPKTLSAKKVSNVIRLGKQIVLVLDAWGKATSYLAIHLRMSGRLYWNGLGNFSEKHLRVECELDKGTLSFVDPRRFGTMVYTKDLSSITPVGIDPFDEEFTIDTLALLTAGSKQPLKHWLLRQDKLVGIGNIYASEILFRAKLHPEQAPGSLSAAELRRLYQSTRQVLSRAIKHCGTTFSDFQQTNGELGTFQNYLKVYGREGLACKRCKTPIQKIVQQQRSTFFCSACQIN